MAVENGKYLVKNISLRIVREKGGKYASKKISCKENVSEILKPHFEGSSREMIFVVGLNNQCNITCIYMVGAGGPASCNAHPAEVFKPLIASNSTGFILAHNHPSGTIDISKADIEVTSKIHAGAKALDLHFMDHIIFCNCETETKIVSIREQSHSAWGV